MSFVAHMRSAWRNLTRRGRQDEELDAELRAYVTLLTDEKMRRGLSFADARRAALLELGGMDQVKEQVRDVRSGAMLDATLQDIRYAWRTLGRAPAFAGAAALALALGIGGTSAIFSVVDGVLLRPLRYERPDRMVVLMHRLVNPVAPANFFDWKRQSTSFERMGAAEYWQANVSGGGFPEKVQGVRLTNDALALAGVEPLLGRLFSSGADEPGRDREVVLAWGFWQRRFAGDAAILGKAIHLDGEPYTIVGVMPRHFDYPMFWAAGAQLWAPLAFAPKALGNREGQSLRILARLHDGVSLAQARSEMTAITARLERENPGTNRNVTVTPITELVTGDVKPALLVVLGAVGFLLLLACANVAHMLLARGAARQREITVRAALGATRQRLVRQLLTESFLLAVAGGVIGLGIARVGVHALVTLSAGSLPRSEEVVLDWRAVSFTLALTLLTGVGFGVVPALRASRDTLIASLRDGGRWATVGRGHGRLRNLLVASEFALALVLLSGAGLAIRSFIALRAVDPGFDPRGVATLVVSFTGSAEAVPNRRGAFMQQLVERVRALHGVEAASAINHLPLAGDIWGMPFFIEGRPRPRPGDTPTAAYRVAFPGYFATMRIPLERGRDISFADRVGSPGTVVVNDWFARKHWPGENPIGKRITLDEPDEHATWLTVVGVVKNAVRSNWTAPPDEEMYIPWLQEPQYLNGMGSNVGYMTVVARAKCAPPPESCDAAALVPAIRGVVWSFNRDLPVTQVQTMGEVIDAANAQPRFNLVLLAAFATIALVLAAVGVYGVMSYAVSRRTHEIGVRMALGAKPVDVVRLVVRQGMSVAMMGGAVGVVGALALTRLMTRLLYGVAPSDPTTFTAVSGILVLVALVGSYLPARHAARVDPLLALRGE